jgi:hypothetical protein
MRWAYVEAHMDLEAVRPGESLPAVWVFTNVGPVVRVDDHMTLALTIRSESSPADLANKGLLSSLRTD